MLAKRHGLSRWMWAISLWLMLAVQQLYGQQPDVQLPIPIRFGAAVTEQPSSSTESAIDEASRTAAQPTRPAESATATATSDGPSPAASAAQLRLPPRYSAAGPTEGAGESEVGGNAFRTLSSLAVVLGLFCLFIWFVRKHRLPSGDEQQLFQPLGRVSLLGKQAHVVKFGDKLLLLAKTATGLEKLAELSHPEEVERITRMCLQGGSRAHLTRSVSQVLASHESAGKTI